MGTKNIGSDFDSFLADEGVLADVEATAAKRVLAYQIAKSTPEKTGQETLRATSRGNIEMLVKSDIYDINVNDSDNQADKQDDNQSDKQATTNKK